LPLLKFASVGKNARHGFRAAFRSQAPVRAMSAVALLLPIVGFALLYLNTETKVATAFAYGSLLGEPSGWRPF
jgi:hypothetical protein